MYVCQAIVKNRGNTCTLDKFCVVKSTLKTKHTNIKKRNEPAVEGALALLVFLVEASETHERRNQKSNCQDNQFNYIIFFVVVINQNIFFLKKRKKEPAHGTAAAAGSGADINTKQYAREK